MPSSPARIAVVGGGLAGLAAASALAARACRVELFEARRQLGGRAGSFVSRETDEAIDHCQHVAMGCCTNFLDWCRRNGALDLLRLENRLHFLGAGGERTDVAASRWLPPPLHLALPLLRMRYLSVSAKLCIARGMWSLMRMAKGDLARWPTVRGWLTAARQTPQAIERFWKVVLVSALGESLEQASLSAARQVFIEGFLVSREAMTLYVPRVSLSQLYDERIAQSLQAQGVTLRQATPVKVVLGTSERVTGVLLASGETCEFDHVVVAVPWSRLAALLPSPLLAAVDPKDQTARLRAAPITAIHLWLDRPITDVRHAVFVGRLSQWLFARQDLSPSAGGHYYQVVISASHDLAGRPRSAVIDEVMADLRAVFPAAAEATLLRWQLVTDRDAVFSASHESTSLRLPQATPIPNLFLAGDWTQTGWPATMEGAVRSGYRAAEGVLDSLGRPESVLVPDLPWGRLARMIIKP